MAKTLFPSDQQDKFMLRLPDGMRERIKRAAMVNNRSMNAEILATLEDKYPSLETLPDMPEFLLEKLRKSGLSDINDPKAKAIIEEAYKLYLLEFYDRNRLSPAGSDGTE